MRRLRDVKIHKANHRGTRTLKRELCDLVVQRKVKQKNTFMILDKDFPLLAGDSYRYKNLIDRFKDWLPSMYRRYITHIKDTQPDGNCGFRSVAMGLGLDQNEWKWFHQQLWGWIRMSGSGSTNSYSTRCSLTKSGGGLYSTLSIQDVTMQCIDQ